MSLVNHPTSRTARKVKAATIGAGGGAALSVPIGEIVSRIIVEVAPFSLESVEVQIAMVITGAMAGAGAWLSGYYAKAHVSDVVL